MASIRFLTGVLSSSGCAVDTTAGHPRTIGVKRGGETASVLKTLERGEVWEEGLETLYRVLQIVAPPASLLAGVEGMEVPSAMTDAVFGVGRRSHATFTTVPTGLVVGDGAARCRAWALRKEWTEGGGENWFGSPNDCRAYVAGFWLREMAAIKWAAELVASSPLVAALVAGFDAYAPNGERPPVWVDLPAGTEIGTIEGIEVTSRGDLRLSTGEDKGDAPVGVVDWVHVRFGRWQGTVRISHPEMWQVRAEVVGNYPLTQQLVLRCQRGSEVRRLLVAEEGEPIEETYVSELPAGREFVPTNASGTWATFWPSESAWEVFAKANMLLARGVSTLHSPDRFEGEARGFFIPLTREWAEKAWAAGATMLPAADEVVELPEAEASVWVFGPSRTCSGNELAIREGRLDGAHLTADKKSVFLPMSGNNGIGKTFHGWLRAPRGLEVGHAVVLREVGDVSDGYDRRTSVTVFTDGSVSLPSR